MSTRDLVPSWLRRWRPRISLGALMLLIAFVAVWLAWTADRSRRIVMIDLGAPGLIAVGDEAYDLPSLQSRLARGQVEEVVIRPANNVPHSFVMRVLTVVSTAGVRKIHFDKGTTPPNPTLQRPLTNPTRPQSPGIPKAKSNPRLTSAGSQPTNFH